jgi:hypothetical protein
MGVSIRINSSGRVFCLSEGFMTDNEIDSHTAWSLWRSLETDNGGN